MASPKSTSVEIPIPIMPIGSGSRVRSASSDCPGSRSTLPNWVSKWNRGHVEKVLHIVYEQNTCGMAPQLLEKIPKMKKLTSEQKKYTEILRNTTFGPNLKKRTVWSQITCDYVEQKLKEACLQAKSSEDLISGLPNFGQVMYVRVLDYFDALLKFVENRRQTWTPDENNEFKQPRVCEEEYSLILSSFAKMCGLDIAKGLQCNQAKWNNLRGNEYVISRPDFRFHATGQNFDPHTNTSKNLLTVVEVKGEKEKTDTEDDTLKRKRQNQSEIRAKRRCITSTSSTSSSTCGWQSSPVHAFQTGRKVKPYIEFCVSSGTLGQHAGELLLDLNKYVISPADISTASILYMPGMIVDQTVVFLTLLEISAQHFKKLTGTEQPLTKDDKATIYYSEALDIMDKQERRILIDTFVNLNNIESLLI